ncbi:chemotaxis-specific protein-glutamate methyltransferase CheB [Catenuloplanes atrovinosus]|uniref:Protein-glutamate methylesterase/protein-glutamine glutaminase n=1 Tax=Catenuloplanes atrovinosus TaxID=137266 RepID=A0AAE3YMH6_9ACTN|nr:chemotaxis-specific protein-glutamate methyltransferase CheB [Catenuloplanes atrovinosus]MDR7276245.1 two-component system chemotaxis response regulator CheB [Catenuloplanes atrovinosus]
MIRVLVVEDSATVRAALREALTLDPGVQIVGEAVSGTEAVEKCRRLRPDVITMDVMLPGMSGLEATEQIMQSCPTPILVVSSAARREALGTYDVLAAGAVDVLEKPRGDDSDHTWGARLRTAVKVVSRIRVVTRRRMAAPEPTPVTEPANRATGTRLVVIGASTGGPGAITQILSRLPVTFPLPILYVQHLSANEAFATAFTDWLAGQVRRPVSYAASGVPVSTGAGRIIVAPPNRHLLVRGGTLHLSDAPERHSCRPSVDTLFESVAEAYGPTAAGALLTGMGRDGAAGLLAMRRAGARTYAQDEATSVVYGMPREAVQLGAAAESLPPAEIAERLAALV